MVDFHEPRHLRQTKRPAQRANKRAPGHGADGQQRDQRKRAPDGHRFQVEGGIDRHHREKGGEQSSQRIPNPPPPQHAPDARNQAPQLLDNRIRQAADRFFGQDGCHGIGGKGGGGGRNGGDSAPPAPGSRTPQPVATIEESPAAAEMGERGSGGRAGGPGAGARQESHRATHDLRGKREQSDRHIKSVP